MGTKVGRTVHSAHVRKDPVLPTSPFLRVKDWSLSKVDVGTPKKKYVSSVLSRYNLLDTRVGRLGTQFCPARPFP